MGMHIDTDCARPIEGTGELLYELRENKLLSLGVLSGAELSVLGGTEHPTCWEALRDAWQQLDPRMRQRQAEVSTARLLHRGLIIEQLPGRGVQAVFFPACYKMSAELSILLGARESPASVIATHHESRSPGVTYFLRKGTGPAAIVEEIPERADNGRTADARTPLDVIFSYRLLTAAFAGRELARWALKPVPGPLDQPKSPRQIRFSRGAGGDRPQAYQLAISGDGRRAHVEGPNVSADFGAKRLTRFMTDLVTNWTVEKDGTRSDLFDVRDGRAIWPYLRTVHSA